MQSNTCKVCGGADMNLVDGFYYCVECGTQDENIQERIVTSELYIGLHTRNAKSKIRNDNEKLNLGPEWCKWHAFNFIIAGLTDELIVAGAKPSVKMKVFWIWTKYMKLFRVKVDRPKSQFFSTVEDNQNEKEHHDDDNEQECDDDHIDDQKDNPDINNVDYGNINEEDDNDLGSSNSDDDKYADRKERMKSLIKHVSKAVIIAIFHIALNLDRSDIQLSHLLRYVKWRNIDISTCTKYVPKDLDVTCIPHFKNFKKSIKQIYRSHTIRYISMALIKCLNLGLPVVPDMRKMVDNYIKELCLPEDFKDLVLSLMHQYPSHHIQLSKRIDYLVIIPDYEAICLSYFIVAFKLCFGLDDDYECKLSDVVNKINTDKSFNKSYKVGAFSESTDRIFSFREWCEYMKVRKNIVCKHNLQMARLYRLDVNDYVFLEHLDKIKTKPSSLTNDIVKDILNKIPPKNEMSVIPKDEFDLSFTPMASNSDVILDYIQDPDLRLMLSEDFTQYSLEYAIKRLQLKENIDSKNIVKGVSDNNKILNKYIRGHLNMPIGDDNKMLYIRFCEKKDISELPAFESSTFDMQNDKEYNSKTNNNESYNNVSMNDGYEENAKTVQIVTINNDIGNDKSKIDDEMSILLDKDHGTVTFVDYPNACIYDDDNKEDVKQAITTINESCGTINDKDFYDYVHNLPSPDNQTNFALNISETPDRRTLINDLVQHACKTYKISIPRPKKPKVATKNKTNPTPKKRPYVPAEFRNGKNMRKADSILFLMLSSYYKNTQESTNNEENDVREQSPVNESIQENIQEPTWNADSTENTQKESEPSNTTVDCEILENCNINEMECLLDSDDDENDDEFTLPEIAKLNEDDVLKLDKATNKILHIEINKCGMPPKNKIKFDENMTNNKPNAIKADIEKILHPSAWGVQNFNYWIRHYSIQTQILKSKDVHGTFNFELFDNLPKSFGFVLQECGSIIDCTPFRLYRQMEYIEKHILLKLKSKKQKTIRKSDKKHVK